jgi:hypothetical protein
MAGVLLVPVLLVPGVVFALFTPDPRLVTGLLVAAARQQDAALGSCRVTK